MPNIATYEAQGSITPSDKGIQGQEDLARVAGRKGQEIGRAVSQIGEMIDKHLSTMESSEIFKTAPQLELNLKQSYDHDSSLPENRADPHFSDRWLKEVAQPLIEKWKGSPLTDHGRELGTRMGSDILSGINRHAYSGQAAMDTEHATTNLEQTFNSYKASVAYDPSRANTDKKMDMADTAVQAATANIPDVERREATAGSFNTRGKAEIMAARYQSAIDAVIKQVGETGDVSQSTAYAQTQKDVQDGYGHEFMDLSKVPAHLEEAVRQGMQTYRTGTAQREKTEDSAIDDALLKVEASTYQPNGAGGVAMTPHPEALAALRYISSMPGAGRNRAAIEGAFRVLNTATQEQLDGKNIATDPDVYNSLFARVGSTANPLTRAEVDLQREHLSNKSWSELRSMAADSKQAQPKVQHVMTELNHHLTETFKPLISGSNMYGAIDPSKALNYGKFAYYARNRLQNFINAGLDPDASLNVLMDPNGPNSFYRDLPQYMSNNKQGLEAILNATKPSGGGAANLVQHTAPPARNPGESTADYIKRTQ